MRRWDDCALPLTPRQAYSGGVAVTTLRTGFNLVLCDMAASNAEPVEHEEPADLIGLGFHLRGGARFSLEQHGFTTCPGDCWIAATPRGARSVFDIGAEGFRTLSLRLSPEASDALFPDDGPFPRLAARGRNGVALRHGRAMQGRRLQKVEDLFAHPYVGTAQRLLIESAALSLLAWQIEAMDETEGAESPLTPRDLARMREARERLDARLDAPPSLAELARAVGINDFKLKRDFKRVFGLTVFGHVRQQRMRRAADQLRQGLSVQQAALDVGYACPSRFAQAFRTHHGVTPSAFRRRPV